MEVTPGTPAKRPRAKAQDTNAKPKAAKPRARKTAAPKTSAPEAEVSAPAMPSPEQIQGMIATAAYYMAAERNFAPGRELDDWLEAERRVRATLFG